MNLATSIEKPGLPINVSPKKTRYSKLISSSLNVRDCCSSCTKSITNLALKWLLLSREITLSSVGSRNGLSYSVSVELASAARICSTISIVLVGLFSFKTLRINLLMYTAVNFRRLTWLEILYNLFGFDRGETSQRSGSCCPFQALTRPVPPA